MQTGIKNILLAEDERGTALLVKRELERQGFNVRVAGNGREALDIIHAEKIDLLITDVVMPEMDGVDLYLALKKEKSTESLPIIIITDKEMFQDSFATLGVDHFVDKASNIDMLLKKVTEIGLLSKEAKHYRKVLVSGSNHAVLAQMSSLLQGRECLVVAVNDPAEITPKAFQMKPNIILLDILAEGPVRVQEMIRSLRCYDFLKECAILTYVHFSPDAIGQSQGAMELIGDQIKECQEAGATKYLGRFNRVTFLESLKEFGVF
jgi:CheY-like chemotaxis protein